MNPYEHLPSLIQIAPVERSGSDGSNTTRRCPDRWADSAAAHSTALDPAGLTLPTEDNAFRGPPKYPGATAAATKHEFPVCEMTMAVGVHSGVCVFVHPFTQ